MTIARHTSASGRIVEQRLPATPRQLSELREVHGYTGTVYSHEEAQKLLIERRKIAKQGLVTAWERGERLLAEGYTVEPMEGHFCYRVSRPTPTDANPDGPTVAYHVCLIAGAGLPPCDCPDATRHADTDHVCKHALAARVQLWQWAQDSDNPNDYHDYLMQSGVMALRAATRKRKTGRGAINTTSPLTTKG